eukprot:8168394-Pyramimonas_sp.AAC.1
MTKIEPLMVKLIPFEFIDFAVLTSTVALENNENIDDVSFGIFDTEEKAQKFRALRTNYITELLTAGKTHFKLGLAKLEPMILTSHFDTLVDYDLMTDAENWTLFWESVVEHSEALKNNKTSVAQIARNVIEIAMEVEAKADAIAAPAEPPDESK